MSTARDLGSVTDPSKSSSPHSDPQAATASDQERLLAFAEDLANQIDIGLPRWIRESLGKFLDPDQLLELQSETEAAEREASTHVMIQLRSFLDQDIDQQRTTPLAILRQTVPLVTKILHQAGVPSVNRDRDAARLHPEDWYDLTPASYGDFGDEVQQASLLWGAAKAHIHIQRRRAE